MDVTSGDHRSHVLLGYDGTEENEPALRWAVEEARLRGLDLVVCHCWRWPYPEGHVDGDAEAVIRRVGENLLELGASRAREMGAEGRIRKRLMRAPAPDALLRESRGAELIVVGSHERHDMPLGSTVLRLPARAQRPVIVVRSPCRPRGETVAGVDGSPGGDAALGFAFEEAALRGWRLRVVYACWEPGAVDDSELVLFSDKDRLRQARTALLEKVAAPWQERYPAVDATVSLLLERPREALLDAAETADLLVVGDRGIGGLDPLLLGATSSALLHDAPCTIAVVPPVPGDSRRVA